MAENDRLDRALHQLRVWWTDDDPRSAAKGAIGKIVVEGGITAAGLSILVVLLASVLTVVQVFTPSGGLLAETLSVTAVYLVLVKNVWCRVIRPLDED